MIKVKSNKRKLPIILLITFILVLLLFISINNKYFYKINNYFTNIGSRISNLFIINNLNNDINLGINRSLEEENNELKKLLNLKIENYEMITAKVIKRDNWYQTITINKGKKDKLKKNMAVLDSNSLIGKIIDIGDNYSVIQLITSNLNNSKVAVDIKNDNTYHGILDSYDKENNLIIIKNVNKTSIINKKDKVYTNGLGGIYPEGIYIGKVVSIEEDNLNLSKIVKVKVDKDFDNIRYVNIIRK